MIKWLSVKLAAVRFLSPGRVHSLEGTPAYINESLIRP